MTDPLPVWSDLSPDERMAIISPLWFNGLSNATIAMRFTGATRNSVIGQIHRAKLKRVPGTPKVKTTRRATKIKYAEKEKPSVKATPMRHSPIIIPTVNPDIPVALDKMITTNRPPLAGIVPISILELPMRPGVRCRFPVEGGYCGADSGDQVYCPTHDRICHVGIEKKKDPVRWANEHRKAGLI